MCPGSKIQAFGEHFKQFLIINMFYFSGKNPHTMDYRERISRRIQFDDIMEVLYVIQNRDEEKEKLYKLIFDEDKQVAKNALWIFTHFTLSENEWLNIKHYELINETMSATDSTQRRLLLTLLNRQTFSASGLRTDFFDFCLEHAMMTTEPAAVRSLCLKLAFAMSVHFPELLTELQNELEIMPDETLSPAVKSTKKRLMKEILALNRKKQS